MEERLWDPYRERKHHYDLLQDKIEDLVYGSDRFLSQRACRRAVSAEFSSVHFGSHDIHYAHPYIIRKLKCTSCSERSAQIHSNPFGFPILLTANAGYRLESEKYYIYSFAYRDALRSKGIVSKKILSSIRQYIFDKYEEMLQVDPTLNPSYLDKSLLQLACFR